MAVNNLLVKSYALNIYLTGKNSFANVAILKSEYVEPIKIYAAKTYWIDDIDNALNKAFITPEEHAYTLALKGAEDPQVRPPYGLMKSEVVV